MDENNVLLIKDKQQDLLLVAKQHNLEMSDQEVDYFDISDALALLNKMQPDQQLSTKLCKILLDSMNILEDMAKALSIPVGIPTVEENKKLDVVYDKIFWGNNLPSVTPEGKSYHPLFLSDEIVLLTTYFHQLWDAIYSRIKSEKTSKCS